MKVEMRLHGLNGVLATLQSLPPEVVSRRGGVVKSALRRGALVILKAEKVNLQAVTSNATSTGKRESTGFLLKHLIASRGKAPAGGKGERYLVRVKRKKYPEGDATTTQVANLLEYGSSKQPAEPFIRPAFQAKAQQSIETIRSELIKKLDQTVKKLAAQNRGK